MVNIVKGSVFSVQGSVERMQKTGIRQSLVRWVGTTREILANDMCHDGA